MFFSLLFINLPDEELQFILSKLKIYDINLNIYISDEDNFTDDDNKNIFYLLNQKDIKIPDGYKQIGEFAFSNCKLLTSIILQIVLLY
mgnify:CR=1 FL=1